MVERLNQLDASFLDLEQPGTPMHVGGVLILETPPRGVEALEELVESRLPLVPRYRQRVLVGPGQSAVTWTPVPRTSSCSASVKLSTNALVAK